MLAIPDWVVDFESYRRWAHSADYPHRGQVSFLDGEIWIDMSREELFTHADPRSAYCLALVQIGRQTGQGEFVGAGMFFTNRGADLATEPDGMFYKWSTMKSGRFQPAAPRMNDYMELTGAPDIVLEIMSPTSERRDKDILPVLYWKAGIPEYWLVNACAEAAQFGILRHTEQRYVATPASDGWSRSDVLGRDFRLVRQTDPLGHPHFVVEVR